jgi:hypothetical protein
VVTAAHCLPRWPPQPSSFEERTYFDFVGSIEEVNHEIAVECLFADPISDVAILAAPDSQRLHDECTAFEQFVSDRPAFSIESERTGPGQSSLFGPDPATDYALTLQNDWRGGSPCVPPFIRDKRTVMLSHDSIVGGMSGSPLISETGHVLSLVSISELNDRGPTDSSQPYLAYCLPRWAIAAFSE